MAKSASIVAAKKYAIKACEVCKMAAKISEEAVGKSATECAKNKAGKEGEALRITVMCIHAGSAYASHDSTFRDPHGSHRSVN